MSEHTKRLHRLSQTFSLVIPYIKFFILVALNIMILYERHYVIAALVTILFVASIVIDFLIYYAYKTDDKVIHSSTLFLLMTLYLTLFGFLVSGIPGFIELIQQKKNPKVL